MKYREISLLKIRDRKSRANGSALSIYTPEPASPSSTQTLSAPISPERRQWLLRKAKFPAIREQNRSS